MNRKAAEGRGEAWHRQEADVRSEERDQHRGEVDMTRIEARSCGFEEH